MSTQEIWINVAYLVATILFVWGLKKLTSPATARMGNIYSAVGMLIAMGVTLLSNEIVSYQWIAIGLVIGTLTGIIAAYTVAMTAMPEMVALLNGLGGLASLLVGIAANILYAPLTPLSLITILLSIIIGAVTFFGSMVAWAKLRELLSGTPTTFPGYKMFNASLLVLTAVFSVLLWFEPHSAFYFYSVVILSSVFGVLSVMPIGGADMPVVISLLNSFSGLAASTTGFVVNNILLVVAGALVGASGIILSILMCKAMNRSLVNVLLGGFGASSTSTATSGGQVTPITAQDAYYVLEAAQSVCIVPGYGLAVAQAQHAIRELTMLLEKNGTQVCYGIHPVAGRMPGHMNVLLAEANVPYEQLYEMEKTNNSIGTMDVCIVIGANDVVNLSARDPGSSIAGMPIINVDQAKVVIVVKRSMKAGFSGVDNPLFYKPNTRMFFGDAKSAIQNVIAEFKTT